MLTHEIAYRIEFLTSEIHALDDQVADWAYTPPDDALAAKRFHALVLDTGVIEEHRSRDELAQLAPQWLERARRQFGGIRLAIAATSLEEIDRHKSNSGQKMHGGDTLLKTAVRDAQKLLSDLYEAGPHRPLVEGLWHGIFVSFQVRPLNHRPLPISDNEIIAYALELRPFAESVTFVTYDLGPYVTATQQGLRAMQLQYDS